jgi:hypothetical protein
MPARRCSDVAVGVDEARRDIAPGRVDHVSAWPPAEPARRGDAPAAHPDVGSRRRRARTVEHRAAADHEIEQQLFLYLSLPSYVVRHKGFSAVAALQ